MTFGSCHPGSIIARNLRFRVTSPYCQKKQKFGNPSVAVTGPLHRNSEISVGHMGAMLSPYELALIDKMYCKSLMYHVNQWNFHIAVPFQCRCRENVISLGINLATAKLPNLSREKASLSGAAYSFFQHLETNRNFN